MPAIALGTMDSTEMAEAKVGDIDGRAVRRWLKAGQDRVARLRGLRLESLHDDRFGEIVEGDVAALILIGGDQKTLRVPVAALDQWILADVPTEIRVLIEADGHGLNAESADPLRRSGFVPDLMPHAQCTILLKILEKPIDTLPSDVQVLENLLQDPSNCGAAYNLLEFVRDKARMPASTAARIARARLEAINPLFFEDIQRKVRESARHRRQSAIWFTPGNSYAERIKVAEGIFAKSKSCDDLSRLRDAMSYSFVIRNFDDDSDSNPEWDEIAPAYRTLLEKIEARMRDLQCK